MKRFWRTAQPLALQGKKQLQRISKYAPLASFIAGFSWDNLTLSRIDRLSDNLILLAYVLGVGAAIVIFNLTEKKLLRNARWYQYQQWYPLAIQFLFGGLFSAYVIYYSQSASFSKTDLFLLLLLTLFIANEFLKERLGNIYMQVSLYFLVCFAFFTFFLPVVTREMSALIFTLGGFLSLGMVGAVIFLLHHKSALDSRRTLRQSLALITALFFLFNGFYWLNWIPPVPLSLKYGGVFHQVKRVNNDYRLHFEPPQWYKFWRNENSTFHYQSGDTVFCFASVFAPTDLNTAILHHWQKYQESSGDWLTTDLLNYKITGGRDGGYRGYTFKKHLMPGEWRVDVQTRDGKLLSRMNFKVVLADSLRKPLKVKIR